MKHFTVFVLFSMLLTCSLHGQDFGEVGTQWFYNEHPGGACAGNCEYVHLESVVDTVIVGKTTHKIQSTYYRHTGEIDALASIYVYENSDTVFMWDFIQSKFLTTYIFNGNVGDTLILDAPDTVSWAGSTYRLVINSVTTEAVDGIQLKKYGTTAIDSYSFWNGGYFMDKIGGLDWFLPRTVIFPEAGGPIRCYSDLQIDTSFQSINCDQVLYTSIHEPSSSATIQVFPNPTSDLLTVKSNEPIGRLELFDPTGKLIATIHEMTFDLSALSSGLYILEVHMASGQKIERRIIKNVR
jgi:hypothetical protein